MSDERVATFVHISDLHFGNLVRDPVTGELVPDAPTRNLWAIHPLFDGLLGHHYRALVHLEAFVRSLREKERAHLIVTGDVTATGEAREFAMANDFLSGYLNIPGTS